MIKRINAGRKIIYIVYIALFLVISLIPLALMSDSQPVIGNETKAVKPSLSSGAELPSQIDSYFAQNFGLRNRLVYAGNFLKQQLFETSGQSEVIIGEDGWLFYRSALKDYVGTEVMSDLQIEKAAAVVEIMQDYVISCGGEFIFFSAPNKMSVYGEYMPYYYIETSKPGNYEKLYDRLVSLNVCTVNLKNALSLEKLGGVQLYHKLDSHWNNYGAAVAYEAVAGALDGRYTASGYEGWTKYTDIPYTSARSFSGDLQSMLLPGSDTKDTQLEFELEETFEYTGRYTGVDDMLITTENSSASVDKSVTLFRDSFGNALYRFFAQDYSVLGAKRTVPYNIYSAVSESDLVAVELVERNLYNLLVYTPIVPSRSLGAEFIESLPIGSQDSAEVILNVTTTADGLTKFTGVCSRLSGSAYIYMSAGTGEDTLVYRLIPCESEGDFVMYLTAEEMSDFSEYLNADDEKEGGIRLDFFAENGGYYEKIQANVTLQD